MDDLTLVRGILCGDIDSFSILINKYENLIYNFTKKMIRDSEASKDVTQEVFITVYNKLYTYKKEYSFSNWLFQIARNKSVDYIRKNKIKNEIEFEAIGEMISCEISPEQALELSETKLMIGEFLKGLKDLDRQIIILRFLNESMKFSDIAEILNMSESTVKTKYYRMWEKFNTFLVNCERGCRV